MTARDVIAKCLADCAMEPLDEISSAKYNGDATAVLACLCSAPDSVRQELAALLNPTHFMRPPAPPSEDKT